MNEVLTALRRARRIAIVSHRDPDADTIGSGLALGAALASLGKDVSYHCADPVPEGVRFLENADRYTTAPPPPSVDLICTVDFGDPAMTRKLAVRLSIPHVGLTGAQKPSTSRL